MKDMPKGQARPVVVVSIHLDSENDNLMEIGTWEFPHTTPANTFLEGLKGCFSVQINALPDAVHIYMTY